MKNILVFLLTWFIFLQFLDILKISLPTALPTVFFLCKILLFAFLSRHFLGIQPLIFCKFWHGGRNPYEVMQDRVWFSRKFFFDLKLGKWFYGENLNSWCVPVQIPYLAKYLFQRYGPKCSQPIRLQYFIINHISRMSEWNSLMFYMYVDINSHNLKIDFFWGGLGLWREGSFITLTSLAPHLFLLGWFKLNLILLLD